MSRRLNTNIWGTKGEAIALDRRPYPPGERGRSRRRSTASEFLVQMQEKQKARHTYGLTERQFRNLFAEASRRQGVTGENTAALPGAAARQLRLPHGLGRTRPQARQMVNHGHVNRERLPSHDPQLPAAQGRRRRAAGQDPRLGHDPVERGRARPQTRPPGSTAARMPSRPRCATCPSASRSTCRSGSSSSSSCTRSSWIPYPPDSTRHRPSPARRSRVEESPCL